MLSRILYERPLVSRGYAVAPEALVSERMVLGGPTLRCGRRAAVPAGSALPRLALHVSVLLAAEAARGRANDPLGREEDGGI